VTEERPGFDPAKDVLLDPRTLRGIAHPMRVRILSSLREDGPATATALASRLGESSGATSYHLRQLAAHGFVEEDATRGVGRERWWRSVHRGTYSDGASFDGDTRELYEQHLLGVVQMHGLRMRDYADEHPAMEPPWRDAGSISGVVLRLTAEETRELAQRLTEVMVAYRRDDPEVEAPPGTRRVVAQVQVMPRG
jgi:DNA-binding transcriptional ArsR family regulator